MALNNIKSMSHISNLNNTDIRELQTLLKKHGYDVYIDGVYGPLTLSFFNDFKVKNNLGLPGYIGKSTLNKLNSTSLIDKETLGSIVNAVELSTLSSSQILELQKVLNQIGYPVITDGIYGINTLNAFNKFKLDKKITNPGFIGPTTVNILLNTESINKPSLITFNLLDAGMPNASTKDINTYLAALQKYTNDYGINTPLRVAAFLAQLAHESGSFLYKEEIASGAAYEGRKDLGNTIAGDGKRYKG